ncbi:MAG: hypothetical protein JWM58_986 [Rhizobium sp.]|nr:hypothetical protein [Rhizobium sp.]
MDRQNAIYTIGHSNLGLQSFLALLRKSEIEAVADVRSSPWSRFNPQFNRETLKESLKSAGILYSYLGEELGGRPTAPQFYCEGVADYRKMCQAPSFEAGLRRLHAGSANFRIAVMCSEQNPLECHRCLLVGRALHQAGTSVVHLLHDGSSISQPEVEASLLMLAGKDAKDLFAPLESRIADAYWTQNRKHAFTTPPSGEPPASK